MTGLFEDIRAAAARVAAEARSVHVVDARLVPLALELSEAVAEPAQLDPAHHHTGSPESTLAFVITLDAVNFGSGWFPHLNKRPGCSGYFTVANCLKDRFDEAGPLSAEALQDIDAEACAALFEQALRPPIDALMGHFARAWNDLGALLIARFDGSFTALVEAAGRRAERLVALLAEMPLYRDVSRYRGFDVPLYKRAQLTCADLDAAFEGRGPGAFQDMDRLTIFADNLVPHVLRCEGVLDYAPALLARIEAETLIEPGSEEEIEIRAVGLHAVERMVSVLADRGVATTAGRLDYALWNRGQSKAIKASPRHRARSVYY